MLKLFEKRGEGHGFSIRIEDENFLHRKTLDWGGKGGKGGAMRAYKNGFGATPYFLVIANDQEG